MRTTLPIKAPHLLAMLDVNLSTYAIAWRWRMLVVSVIAVMALAGCSTPSTSTQKPTPIAVVKLNGDDMLRHAQTLASPQREVSIIEAANQYNVERRFASAQNALNLINYRTLTTSTYTNYIEAGARAALSLSNIPLAERYLMLDRSSRAINAAIPQQQANLLALRAQLYSLKHENETAVNELIRASSMTQGDQQQRINSQLWRALGHIDIQRLIELANTSISPAMQAWASLSVTARGNSEDLDQQISSLDEWLQRWGHTPIAQNLPSDLGLLREISTERPQNIMLWVPLTGKLAGAGTSIRDGFMAAYYQGLQNASFTPSVRVIDSNIERQLPDSTLSGSDMIIGPLDKQKVDQLIYAPSLEVTTLAINLPSDHRIQSPANLYFFGLDIESEAIQVARRAFTDGKRQAMVFAPEASWGDRATKAFVDEWLMLGGKITKVSKYSAPSQFSKEVEQFMGVQQSQQRANVIRSAVGEALDFRPQRRQDADMIFLLANPSNARQINPMFAYHYGGDLPVYATSQVFSGTVNAALDTDLNGIQFATMPWMFDANSAIKRATMQSIHGKYTAAKLYALGVDLYRLAPRLRQLSSIPGADIQGATGNLSIYNNRVSREPLFAQFKNGRPQPLRY